MCMKKSETKIWNAIITWEKLQRLTNRLSDSRAVFHSNNICPTNQTQTDQLIETYICKRKTRRRPKILFFYILNTSAPNDYIVFSELFSDWRKGDSKKRRHYLQQLGKDLCKPLMEKRSTLPRGNSVLALLEKVRINSSFSSSNRVASTPSNYMTSQERKSSDLKETPKPKPARSAYCKWNENQTKYANECPEGKNRLVVLRVTKGLRSKPVEKANTNPHQ